jgi:aconitate decarboxylase
MVDPGVGFKKHPSNYFTHRPIDAALALREAHGIQPQQIARVDVVFPRFEYVNRPQPETGLDGKFSVQYTTAVALLDGEITVDSFNNERRFAPDVVALLPKIALHFDDHIPNDFDRMHIDMTVTLDDGRVLKQRVDKLSGWIGSPLTREQRMKKFHACARRVLIKEAADRIVALVENLERLQHLDELMTLVRA